MTDRMLEELSERADTSRDTLLEMHKRGLTLVRTEDSDKQNDLKFMLDGK